MADDAPQNFFAVMMEDPAIRRIAVTEPLQRELTMLFEHQLHDLIPADVELVKFDPGYTASDGEVLYIPEFEPSAEVWEAVANPLACAPLKLDVAEVEGIRAILTGGAGRNKWISAQVFDRRRVLSRTSFSIILANETFRRLTEPGLVLDSSLAAHLGDKRLYFKSYQVAKRVFDLSDYYREATDKDLKRFAKMDGVVPANGEAFQKAADTWVRHKIASIMDSKVLRTAKPGAIARAAKGFGLTINVRRVNGAEALVLPTEKAELKSLLRFLDEDYYSSPLTSNKFISNSKRRLEVARGQRKRAR